MRRTFPLAVALVVLAGASAFAEAPKRNFLFILADDFGARDLSVEGSAFYETPNIDRIARTGMRFTQGYANCQVCSPSRASIMLGKCPARHGITDWIGAAEDTDWKRNTRLLPARYNRNLPHEDTTLAEALNAAGYRTFFAGKWHLGSEGSWPTDHGFEINVGGWDVGGPKGGYFAPYENPNLNDGPDGESLPIRLGETARFIEEHKGEPSWLSLVLLGPCTDPDQQGKVVEVSAKGRGEPCEGTGSSSTGPARQAGAGQPDLRRHDRIDGRAVGIVLAKPTSWTGRQHGGDLPGRRRFVGRPTRPATCFRGGRAAVGRGIREPYYIRVPAWPTRARRAPRGHPRDFYPRSSNWRGCRPGRAPSTAWPRAVLRRRNRGSRPLLALSALWQPGRRGLGDRPLRRLEADPLL